MSVGGRYRRPVRRRKGVCAMDCPHLPSFDLEQGVVASKVCVSYWRGYKHAPPTFVHPSIVYNSLLLVLTSLQSGVRSGEPSGP